MFIQEQEEREFTITTAAEWDREDARERGYARPDLCWIASGCDVWYRNPYYVGPEQPHPESYEAENELERRELTQAEALDGAYCYPDDDDTPVTLTAPDDIPF